MIAMVARAHACAAVGSGGTGDGVDLREEAEQELAYEIAITDPSEKDHASAGVSLAAARLKAAFSELVRATFALIAALVGRLLLANAAEAVAQNRRRRAVGAERSVLAVAQILEGFFWRRLAERRRALALLGARSVREEDGSKSARAKLATRSYRSGQRASGLGYAASADTPTIHVMLGVSVKGNEQPVYRVRRFVAAEGGFNEVGGYHATDASEAFVAFLSDPELAKLTEEDEQGGPDQGGLAPGSATSTTSAEPAQASDQAA